MSKYVRKGSHKSGDGNVKITAVFKVKKCLFTSCTEFKTPTFEPKHNSLCRMLMDSPDMVVSPGSDESPYALYNNNARKRRIETSPSVEVTPNRMDCTTPLRKSQSLRKLMDVATPDNPVKMAVQKSIQNPDLIGDFSKPCVLPTIDGKHPDLKAISPETMAQLIQENNSKFTVIDCRYPYEFDGGHIRNAQNIYFKGTAEEMFFVDKENLSNKMLIFYCEFSSERAPGMIRYLRSRDRELNKDCYPNLYYPELYVLEGGYSVFYRNFKELCEPKNYKPMLDKEFSDQLSHYRTYCKSWKPKRRCRFRSKTQEKKQ